MNAIIEYSTQALIPAAAPTPAASRARRIRPAEAARPAADGLPAARADGAPGLAEEDEDMRNGD